MTHQLKAFFLLPLLDLRPSLEDCPTCQKLRESLLSTYGNLRFRMLAQGCYLPTELMDWCCNKQRIYKTKGVSHLLRERERLSKPCHRLVWIPERPQHTSGKGERTSTGIMPTEHERLSVVLIAIVEYHPSF